jgi:hypothetical protein
MAHDRLLLPFGRLLWDAGGDKLATYVQNIQKTLAV